MTYSVVWSPTAEETYNHVIGFLMDNYGADTALKIDDKVEKLIQSISTNKHLCPASTAIPTLRRCVISKYLSMVYRIEEDEIAILAFYDNRAKHDF